MAIRNNDSSVVGPVTEITGNVAGEGSLTVEGTVVGSVSVSGAVAIGRDGSVKGDLKASELTLEGKLDGDVDAQGPITIGAQAEYQGVLKGERVTIAPGARVAAQLDTDFELTLDI